MDLTGNVEGCFRGERAYIDQIFTLKQIGEKEQEKKYSMYVSFMELEKVYIIEICQVLNV